MNRGKKPTKQVEPGKANETGGGTRPYNGAQGVEMPQENEPKEVADVYCDGVNIALTPYDAFLVLEKKDLGEFKAGEAITMVAHRVGVVRMSLEHAKVLAILLRKNLRDHEDVMKSPIPMHPELMQKLGISKLEDW